MKPLLIFGENQFASLVGHYIQECREYSVQGFVVDDDRFSAGKLDGFPKYSLSSALELFPPATTSMFVAIGYSSMRARQHIFERVSAQGWQMANCISPNAVIDRSAQIGRNCLVMPGVVIEKGVAIGDNNLIWSNSTICHDTSIGDHNFFAANTTIGGNSKVANTSFFGFSSVVLQGVAVQPETLLGAMSLLTVCETSCGEYLGSPAKLRHRHEEIGICVA